MLAELFFGADPTIVNLFTTPFYQWTILDPVFPANRALAIVGSVFSTEGMVVADASLNAIKSQVGNLNYINSLAVGTQLTGSRYTDSQNQLA